MLPAFVLIEFTFRIKQVQKILSIALLPSAGALHLPAEGRQRVLAVLVATFAHSHIEKLQKAQAEYMAVYGSEFLVERFPLQFPLLRQRVCTSPAIE